MQTKFNYDSKYIPQSFWNILDSETPQRVRILKDLTGSGATYGVMSHTLLARKKIFLIMPTVKLIKDKEFQANNGEFGNKKIISLYSGSQHTNNDIKFSDIILLTPDRFVALYKHRRDEWNIYKNDIIVIDEEHTFEGSANFRESFSYLDHIIQYWKGHIFTITATTPYTLSPTFKQFDEIKLVNTAVPTTTVLSTTHEKTFWNLFTKYHNLGEEIILVTNDIKQIMKVDGDVYTITGPGLDLKLKFKCISKRKKYTSTNITVLSSSATEGIDINRKAHVMIITDFNHQYSAFSVQTIIQALGRPRLGLLESVLLVVNKTVRGEIVRPKRNVNTDVLIKNAENTINKNKSQYTNPNQFYDSMLKAKHDDKCIMLIDNEWIVDCQKACSQSAFLLNANLFHKKDYIKQMNRYSNHNHINFKGINIPKFSDVTKKKVPFNKSHKEFEKYSVKELEEFIYEATYSISDGGMSNKRNSGNMSKSMLVALLLALIKKRLKLFNQHSVYDMFDNVTRADKGVSLLHSFSVYAAHYEPFSFKIGDKNLSLASFSQIESLFNRPYVQEKPKRVCKNRTMLKEVRELHTLLGNLITQSEINAIEVMYWFMFANKKRTALIQKKMDKLTAEGKTADEIKVHKKQLTNSYVQLGAELLNALPDERKVIYSTRTYSALTTLSMSDIMELYPNTVLEIDIKAANPTFIDDIVGSNIASKVYNNIMQSENVTRDEAKVMYNKLLNSTPKQISDIRKYRTLIRWGYTDEQAERIVEESQVKGRMYITMTEAEKEEITRMLNSIYEQSNCIVARRHDSIVMFGHKKDIDVAEQLFRTNIDDVTKYNFRKG